MDRSAGFPKRISGAVHLTGMQPYNNNERINQHSPMLLFYIGLLALSSWAEILLSILILDTNDNRKLKLGYSEVGLCKLFYRYIYFFSPVCL